MYIGIDYGSKLAGTTAITYLQNGVLHSVHSEKKEDADQFISYYIIELNPSQVFIDAPLSLPGAYFGSGDNYFYRQCDHKLKAMSPMFLGGLTARAIKLKNSFPDVSFFETYPKALSLELGLSKKYKKLPVDIPKIVSEILQILPFELAQKLSSWHAVDSLLAFCSAFRYQHQEHIEFGRASEGLIIV